MNRRRFIFNAALGLMVPMAPRIAKATFIMGRRPGASGYNDETTAWLAAVAANAGTVSDTIAGFVDAFVSSAKANGYWSRFIRLNLLCGDQFAAMQVPLVNNAGWAVDWNYWNQSGGSFAPGDYSEANGLQYSGATSCGTPDQRALITGILPASDLTPRDTHLMMFVRNLGSQSDCNAIHVGCYEGSQAAAYMHFLFVENSTASGIQAGARSIGNSKPITVNGFANAPATFVHSYTVASTTQILMRNGTVLGTNDASTASSFGPYGRYLAVYEVNFDYHTYQTQGGQTNQVLWGRGVMPLGAYSIGAGLTETQCAALCTDMTTFQTALGRT